MQCGPETAISRAMSSFSADSRLSLRAASLYVAVAAAGLLAAVFAMEHIGGLAPCSLCVLQRWPHGHLEIFKPMDVAFFAAAL